MLLMGFHIRTTRTKLVTLLMETWGEVDHSILTQVTLKILIFLRDWLRQPYTEQKEETV